MKDLVKAPNKAQIKPSYVQSPHSSSPLLSSVCVLLGVCFAVAAETTPGGRARLPAGGQMGVISLFLPPPGAESSSGKLASHLCVIG